MPSNNYPIIAREGWFFLGLLGLLVIFCFYYEDIAITALAVIVLVTFLFLLRDPRQEVPSSPLAIVSPVYGSIQSIDEIVDPWLGRLSRRIRIKMSLLDVYSLRSPIEGKVVNQWTLRPDGNQTRRQFAFLVRGDEGDEVIVVINLHFLSALLFRFYVHSGERLGHGQRCGYLYFGGLVDILLPQNCSIKVEQSVHIASGSGVLAQLVHNEGASVIRETENA